jgi:hypothetical protein
MTRTLVLPVSGSLTSFIHTLPAHSILSVAISSTSVHHFSEHHHELLQAC